jgi:hypothetical protein
MITIDRVTPKTSPKGRAYVVIEASGRTLSSFDPTWQSYIGRQVDERHIVQKGDYLNLPDTKTVFGIPPTQTAPNGLQAQQTANEKFEILNRKMDLCLEILRAHFKT